MTTPSREGVVVPRPLRAPSYPSLLEVAGGTRADVHGPCAGPIASLLAVIPLACGCVLGDGVRRAAKRPGFAQAWWLPEALQGA
jgi:hypothetical protein